MVQHTEEESSREVLAGWGSIPRQMLFKHFTNLGEAASLSLSPQRCPLSLCRPPPLGQFHIPSHKIFPQAQAPVKGHLNFYHLRLGNWTRVVWGGGWRRGGAFNGTGNWPLKENAKKKKDKWNAHQAAAKGVPRSNPASLTMNLRRGNLIKK